MFSCLVKVTPSSVSVARIHNGSTTDPRRIQLCPKGHLDKAEDPGRGVRCASLQVFSGGLYTTRGSKVGIGPEINHYEGI